MEETEKQERREDIFSKSIRAGKRTYFFDVKATKTEQHYLTITESKRRFNPEQGKFFYEKHKIFLYQEDFEKFKEGLDEAIGFIESGETPQAVPETIVNLDVENGVLDVSFEDLGKEES